MKRVTLYNMKYVDLRICENEHTSVLGRLGRSVRRLRQAPGQRLPETRLQCSGKVRNWKDTFIKTGQRQGVKCIFQMRLLSGSA